MADQFSIPVRIVSNPQGMSDFTKALLAAGVGLIAGLVAEPLRRYFQNRHAISKAADLLHGSTLHEFELLTLFYSHLEAILKRLPPLVEDKQGSPDGAAAQTMLADDQHRLVGIEHWCSDFNTDIYEHYYGDTQLYYDLPHAGPIKVFFEYIGRLRNSGNPASRGDAQLMSYEMNHAIYGLLRKVESRPHYGRLYDDLEEVIARNSSHVTLSARRGAIRRFWTRLRDRT
ncbi:MAG TPA: hypothetical protein VGG72_36310 [Bryobacteraceae bacterium]|jgi:hypothetical protein